MKTSNKVLLIVGVFFLGAYLANTGYHMYNLNKEQPLYASEAELQKWRDMINVVCVNSSDSMLFKKIRIETGINYSNIGSLKQKKDFYENISINEDTLFISDKAAYVKNRVDDEQDEYYIGLPNVERYYWNGKLVKQF